MKALRKRNSVACASEKYLSDKNDRFQKSFEKVLYRFIDTWCQIFGGTFDQITEVRENALSA